MAPRQDLTDRRTDQILAAAEQLAADKVPEALRMDDVAERTGLGKGALYLYFKSKGDLMLAILERTLQKELTAIERISASEGGAETTLRRFVDAVSGGIEVITRTVPISFGFLSLAFRNRDVQNSLRTYLHRYLDALIPIVRTGVETGEFRAVDPEEAAIAIAAVVEGTMLLWINDPTAIDPARHVRSGPEHMPGGFKPSARGTPAGSYVHAATSAGVSTALVRRAFEHEVPYGRG